MGSAICTVRVKAGEPILVAGEPPSFAVVLLSGAAAHVGDGLLPPVGTEDGAAEGDGALREGDVVGLEGLFYGDRQLGSVVATQVRRFRLDHRLPGAFS